MNNSAHLKLLESESIYIMRELANEFERPLMMYSIGKDSSVLLHLAYKAFYPAKIPFPLLHIDTRWKFKEMITPIEFIKRIEPLITSPVGTMWECDGDMWLSDYSKLSEAAHQLQRAVEELKEEEEEERKVSS